MNDRKKLNPWKMCSCLIIAALSLFPHRPACALPLTLQDLFDGQTITIGDKLFANWELEFLDFSATSAPDFAQIEVWTLDDQPLNPGIKFVARDQLAVLGTDFIDLRIGFSVATLNEIPIIKDNSLEILDFEFSGSGGRITIEESVFDDNFNFLGAKIVEADQLFDFFDLYDSIDFPLQSLIFVEKDIHVAGDFPDEIVALETFEQRFSQVPEPATLWLFGVGLSGLGLVILVRGKGKSGRQTA